MSWEEDLENMSVMTQKEIEDKIKELIVQKKADSKEYEKLINDLAEITENSEN